MIHWWWHRGERLRDREQKADEEVKRSRELLQQTNKDLVPIRDINNRNMFADMIRNALSEGRNQGDE